MTHLTTAIVAREMRARGYEVREGPEREVTGGAADSRSLLPGDLFAAFRGENADGNDFVPDAIAAGAVAVVCERVPLRRLPWDVTVTIAPDTTRAMHELAGAWRRECGPRVVGITGTVGKTTAKEAVAAVLGASFATHRNPGNLNSREGLPLALMSLETGHEVSVLEMAMDSPGEIAELCRVAEPEVGIVLNVGLTHVSKMGSIEAIQAEKLSLARWLPPSGTAILNADDPLVAVAAPGLDCHVITFGGAEGATLRHGPVTTNDLEGTTFDLSFEGETVPARSPLPGAHTVPAALAAVASGLALGMGFRHAVDALAEAAVPGRMRRLTRPDGVTILDDSYNASPASMAGALELLGSLPGRRIALIGKMAELGDYEAEEHRRAGSIAARSCDILAAVGEPCRDTVAQARADGLLDATWYAEKDEAAQAVAGRLKAGDTVLLKASRSQAFETLLPELGVEA